MFIPFLYNKVFILFGKLLCFIEILYFKSLRLPQLHFSLDIKNIHFKTISESLDVKLILYPITPTFCSGKEAEPPRLEPRGRMRILFHVVNFVNSV